MNIDRSANDSRFVVIKLGSSTLTLNGQPDHTVIARLCDDLHAIRSIGLYPAVVTSGAVQLGNDMAGTKHDRINRAGRAAVGQIRLTSAISEYLSRLGYRGAQILLKREDFSSPFATDEIAGVIRAIALNNGIPLINENDVTSFDRGFPSNDELSATVASLLSASKLIIFTDRPGVYDADPRIDRKAQLFKTIGAFDEKLLAAASDIPTSTGTGGMRSKILAARMMASRGATTIIARYDEDGQLLRIIQGNRHGTWIVPDTSFEISPQPRNSQLEEESSA